MSSIEHRFVEAICKKTYTPGQIDNVEVIGQALTFCVLGVGYHAPEIAEETETIFMPENSFTVQPCVVAVGASAGGLEALQRLFDGLSCDTGASFVVIQHLSPDHKSMMADLLSRHTTMPVMVVEQDMPIRPDHVYLIPPGAIMHMGDGHLHLTPKNPGTLTLPIDVFFTSVASRYGARCVGVVLSGTGSDGTRGAAAINEAGGFLIAQKPEDAKFDGMPRSVIATGMIDAILTVDQIGPRILAHLLNEPVKIADLVHEPSGRTVALNPEAALSGIMHLLLQLGGIDFQEYKSGTVMRRIERRMTVRQVGALEAYLDLLNDDRNEVLTLRRELLIPVTSFFRDTDAFESLNRLVIEPLVNRKQVGESIRVWTAAISTGEEAYSIAMLFLEAFEQLKKWPNLKIFATDVEQQNIETAGSGIYPESIAAEISAQQLERFFTKKGNNFLVKNELRQCIVFARHNLLTDPPFTKMDLVVCRNALIYFKSPAQERALKRMHYALVKGGHLFQGSSESLGDLQRDFIPVSARHKIWQSMRPMNLPLDMTKNRGAAYGSTSNRSTSLPSQIRRNATQPSAVDIGFSALLKVFSPPPSVLVNSRHELVHSYGDVHRFLQMREGQASLNLNRVLPDSFISVATALLYKAVRENNKVNSDTLRLQLANGPLLHVRLSAWPAGDFEGEHLVLLAFEQVQNTSLDEALNTFDIDVETSERIEVLERELGATRESLQATIEELETSNEELQSTNEELMSSNEELQSANEELQSVNEELITVNAEFQEKIDLMNRLNADLDSMTQAVTAGTVFVDKNLHLTRFSPEAAQIFKLRESDVGRRLDDLKHTLNYPELIHDLEKTLETGSKFETEVTNFTGKHYFVRMLPYSIPSSPDKGVVASFLDVSALHDAQRLQSIIDGLAEHISVLDANGVITMVNKAWKEFARDNGSVSGEQTGMGVNYLDAYEMNLVSEDATAVAAARGIREVLKGDRAHFSIEYPCHSPYEERWFVMHASTLHGEQAGAVVSHVNITEWRQQQLRETS